MSLSLPLILTFTDEEKDYILQQATTLSSATTTLRLPNKDVVFFDQIVGPISTSSKTIEKLYTFIKKYCLFLRRTDFFNQRVHYPIDDDDISTRNCLSMTTLKEEDFDELLKAQLLFFNAQELEGLLWRVLLTNAKVGKTHLDNPLFINELIWHKHGSSSSSSESSSNSQSIVSFILKNDTVATPRKNKFVSEAWWQRERGKETVIMKDKIWAYGCGKDILYRAVCDSKASSSCWWTDTLSIFMEVEKATLSQLVNNQILLMELNILTFSEYCGYLKAAYKSSTKKDLHFAQYLRSNHVLRDIFQDVDLKNPDLIPRERLHMDNNYLLEKIDDKTRFVNSILISENTFIDYFKTKRKSIKLTESNLNFLAKDVASATPMPTTSTQKDTIIITLITLWLEAMTNRDYIDNFVLQQLRDKSLQINIDFEYDNPSSWFEAAKKSFLNTDNNSVLLNEAVFPKAIIMLLPSTREWTVVEGTLNAEAVNFIFPSSSSSGKKPNQETLLKDHEVFCEPNFIIAAYLFYTKNCNENKGTFIHVVDWFRNSLKLPLISSFLLDIFTLVEEMIKETSVNLISLVIENPQCPLKEFKKATMINRRVDLCELFQNNTPSSGKGLKQMTTTKTTMNKKTSHMTITSSAAGMNSNYHVVCFENRLSVFDMTTWKRHEHLESLLKDPMSLVLRTSNNNDIGDNDEEELNLIKTTLIVSYEYGAHGMGGEALSVAKNRESYLRKVWYNLSLFTKIFKYTTVPVNLYHKEKDHDQLFQKPLENSLLGNRLKEAFFTTPAQQCSSSSSKTTVPPLLDLWEPIADYYSSYNQVKGEKTLGLFVFQAEKEILWYTPQDHTGETLKCLFAMVRYLMGINKTLDISSSLIPNELFGVPRKIFLARLEAMKNAMTTTTMTTTTTVPRNNIFFPSSRGKKEKKNKEEGSSSDHPSNLTFRSNSVFYQKK
jgi:hypothetical protein